MPVNYRIKINARVCMYNYNVHALIIVHMRDMRIIIIHACIY